MRRPLLGIAALVGGGSLLVDGEGGSLEALILAGLAAALLGLALAAGGGRAAATALGAAALALGAAGALTEALRFEAGGLRRFVVGGEAEGRAVRLAGVVRGDAIERDGRLAFVLDVDAVETGGRTERWGGRVRVDVGGDGPWPHLLDGDPLAVWVVLRTVPRGEGVREGLAARGHCKSARLVERRAPGGPGRLRRVAAVARDAARSAIVRSMPAGTERGLVRAMVLGDRSEVDEGTAEAFRASGTYHVLALSGAQVALLAGLIVVALRWLRGGPWTQAAVTVVSIGFYSLLVGGDVPVVRAALMAAAVLAGRALELDADAANLLGLAALVLLADRPAVAGDVGFQLSFGATLGILALAGPLTRGVPRLPLRVDLAVAASVAAQGALAPILAGWFHRLAPAAVLLNVAAVPLSGAVLLAGIGVLAAAPLGPGPAGLAGDVAWVAAHALRRSGDLGPLSRWVDLRVASPSFPALALHAAGLGLLYRGRRRLGLGLLVACHVALVLGQAPGRADGRLHLTVIDVGQGDSLLLRSPSGRALLVDAGGARDPRIDPGERRVAPELWRLGVHRLDALVVTHAHPDHVGGAPFVWRAFRLRQLWEGPAPLRDPAWQAVASRLEGAGATRLTVAEGMGLDWDGVRLSVLGPLRPQRPPSRVRNEDSIVLDVAYSEVHLLLTGDVAGDAERSLRAGPSIVLKVPHHGSRSSSGSELVARVGPRLAVVSAGAHNPFGHPHPEVLERYRRAGALVLRTDRDGTVEIATDGRACVGADGTRGRGASHPLKAQQLVLRSRRCATGAGGPAGGAVSAPARSRQALMSETEKPFTVSDRRHFTPEGRPRDEADDEPAGPAPPRGSPAGARSGGAACRFLPVPPGPGRAGGSAPVRRRPPREHRSRGGARGGEVRDRHPRDAEGEDRGATDGTRGGAARRAPLPTAHGLRREDAGGGRVSAPLLAGLLLLLAQPVEPVAGPPPSAKPDSSPPGAAAPAASARFENLWSAYVKADASGDAPAAEQALRAMRRARIERNVESLDTAGLGLVERGVSRLDEGRREEAEGAFQAAVDLAPRVPDAYAGLAVARLKKGLLGVMPSIEATTSGLSAFLASGRGSLAGRNLGTVAALLAAFGGVWALGVALLLRRGGLLRHDVEEWLGPGQSRSTSLALVLLLFLLPVATFQGWGWLPLWWLALLFAYLDARERGLVVVALVAALAVGPAVAALDLRLRAARNPLFDAALAAVESVPDDARRAALEEAVRADPADRDLVYLLAAACRRAGRYQEAAGIYQLLLSADPADPIAQNNLANIEFVRGSYDSARARYRAGTQAGGRRRSSRPPTTTSPSRTCRSSSTRPTTRPSRTPTASPRGSWPTTTAGSTTRATTRWSTSASRASRSGTSSPGRRRGSRRETSPRPGAGRRGPASLSAPWPTASRPRWPSSCWRPSSSRAGGGRGHSRCTVPAAGRPSVASATWGW